MFVESHPRRFLRSDVRTCQRSDVATRFPFFPFLSLEGLFSAKPLRSLRLCVKSLPGFDNLQTCQRSNVSTRLDPKSLPLNPFTDPHPLTPVGSILYKNKAGRGTCPNPVGATPTLTLSPLAATLTDQTRKCCKQKTYARLTPQLNHLDATLTKNQAGGRPQPSTFQPSKMPTYPRSGRMPRSIRRRR